MTNSQPADEPDLVTPEPEEQPSGRMGQPVSTAGHTRWSVTMPAYQVEALDALLRDRLGVSRNTFVRDAILEKMSRYGIVP